MAVHLFWLANWQCPDNMFQINQIWFCYEAEEKSLLIMVFLLLFIFHKSMEEEDENFKESIFIDVPVIIIEECDSATYNY